MPHEVTRMLNGRPLWIIYRSKRARPAWDADRMLDLANARDNGRPYVIVKSRRTVRDLERLFRQREVAGLLEESVGGIVGGFGYTEPGYLKMQLDLDNPKTREMVLLCLEEVGVTVTGP